MSCHNPKERSEEFLAEVRYKWRLNDLGQLVVNNKYHKSGEVGRVFTGSLSKGYRQLCLLGSTVQEHHAVWYLNTGEWPKQPLDHIDGDGTNNHPDNLRLSTNKENLRGFRKIKKGASSKYRGVTLYTGLTKWRSQIMTDGGRKHLGYFTCEKEAALAFNYAAIKCGFPPEGFNQVFADDEVT
jgi:hypothetical protein